MKKSIVIGCLLLGCVSLKAQYVEDALRYSQPNGIITARSAALGVAFHGIDDDYAALYYNPAGLSLVNKDELNVGLGFLSNSTNSNYMNSNYNFTSNNQYISHIGMVVPFSMSRKRNAAIAIGYFLESNFDNNSKYDIQNSSSSMIKYEAEKGPANLDENWAYHLWLANNKLYTPINSGLEQKSFTQESGGIHNITGGAAFDITDNISLGFNIEGKWGTYQYDRTYNEYDVNNKYNTFDSLEYSNVDFNQLNYYEKLKQDISGVTGGVGIQARYNNNLRFSIGVKFPTYYNIDETYTVRAEAIFDNGWTPSPYDPDEASTSYNISTPFVFSGGISYHMYNLTIAAGIEYRDVTQLKFRNSDFNIETLNSQIVQDLTAQTTLGLGAEYDIPNVPVVLRASYSSTNSPYNETISGASLQQYAFGAGVYLAPNVRVDGVLRWSKQTQLRTAYGNDAYSRYNWETKPLNIALQLTYRY